MGIIKKKGNVNGRRAEALKRLEKQLIEWNKHDHEKASVQTGEVLRSHEAEKNRIEYEISRLKAHLAGQF